MGITGCNERHTRFLSEFPEWFDEFQEGFRAFFHGARWCPYQIQAVNAKRYLWWRGYLHARAAHLL